MQEGNGQFHADNVLQHVMDYSENMIICGCDTETTNWGFLSQWKTITAEWLHTLGKKHIFISPELNWYGATSSQRPTVNNKWDKWIPTIPNTEAAMWQAIAYVWLTEGTYDKDYINTYSVDFNLSPGGFVEYIMGKEDGVPKTPEWAAPLCGVPARIIKALAHDWAAHPTAFLHNNSGPYVRGPYSHEAPRFECFLLAMQAVGKKPGSIMYKTIDEEASHGSIFSTKDEFSFPAPMAIFNTAAANRPSGGAAVQTISRAYRAFALNGTPIDWFSNSGVNGMLNIHLAYPGLLSMVNNAPSNGTSNYPPQNGIKVKMIWDAQGNWPGNCAQAGNQYYRAVRTPGNIEFVLTLGIWQENNGYFSDIELPIQTLYEQTDLLYTGYEAIMSIWYQAQAIPPLGESKSDMEAILAIAQKMDQVMPGYDFEKKFIGDAKGNLQTVDQMLSAAYAKCGTVELGQKGLPQGFPYPIPDWPTLKSTGYWNIPFDPNWNSRPLSGAWAAFMANPNDPKSAIDTPSGKIEFYSHQWEKAHPNLPLSSKFYNKTIDKDYEHPPMPHWGVKPYAPYGYWHGDPTIGSEHAWEWFNQDENPRAKVFPIILETGKPKWRQHSMNDGMAWTAEISETSPDGFGAKVRGGDGYLYEPVWIHPTDANPRGIKSNDVVQVWNERGIALGGARVTERMRPGTVYMEKGARADVIHLPDNPANVGETIDRGGNTNPMCPEHGNSENARHSGQWTAYLVQVQKADLAALNAKYPDAMHRPYDPAYGLMAKAWVMNWPSGSTGTAVNTP
jgi:anaerobic selenocysteine-containing dehydrogenase